PSTSHLFQSPRFPRIPPDARAGRSGIHGYHPHSLAGLDRSILMTAPVSLTFPDGSVREYPAGSTGRDVAEAISKSLAKKAIAIVLDGELRDLSDPVVDGRIEIVTR